MSVRVARGAAAGALVLVGALIAVAMGARSRPMGATAAPASGQALPSGDILAADARGHLLELDGSGRLLRRLASPASKGLYVQGVDLSADRRSAFVALGLAEGPNAIFQVVLPAGPVRQIAQGISPAVAPTGDRLAYVRTDTPQDIRYRTRLVVRDLASGRERSVPFGPPPAVLGTPPELIVNWAPDGRRIALVGSEGVRIVDLSRLPRSVAQAARVPGDAVGRNKPHLLAPVFLDERTLVGLTNCCIRPQRLVAVDLRTGRRGPFATLLAPPESIRSIGDGTLLVVTATHELLAVTRGRVQHLREGVLAASA